MIYIFLLSGNKIKVHHIPTEKEEALLELKVMFGLMFLKRWAKLFSFLYTWTRMGVPNEAPTSWVEQLWIKWQFDVKYIDLNKNVK